MPSFDIVSEVNPQEVLNAVDQAQREIGTRYDFKDSKSSIELKELTITLLADDNLKLKAMQEIIKLKVAGRGTHVCPVCQVKH